MSDIRQMPLFPSQPLSEDELNAHTRLQDTIALFQRFLIRSGKSQHTLKAFTADMGVFADFVGDETEIGEFSTTRLNEFLHWLLHERGVPCSQKTYARRVTTLKVYFKWLHEIGALNSDPAHAVLQVPQAAPLAVVLTPDETDDALEFARNLRGGEKPDARPETLFRLLLETGIKKNEALSLTPAIIDRSALTISVRHKSQKDVYKERIIPISREWLAALDQYIGEYVPRSTVFDCAPRTLEYVLEDLSTNAGIGTKISFELLRWTCAVRDFRAGMAPEAIRDKLGLSEITWHDTYKRVQRLAAEQEKK